jgi:hypothetical protein
MTRYSDFEFAARSHALGSGGEPNNTGVRISKQLQEKRCRMRDVLLEGKVEAVLQEAQDATLRIDLPKTLIVNSLVRPAWESVSMLLRGLALSDFLRSGVRYAVGLVFALLGWRILASALDPQVAASLETPALLAVMVAPLLLVALRPPTSVSRGTKTVEPIRRVEQRARSLGISTELEIGLVEKGLLRRQAKATAAASAIKWSAGIAWVGWVYLFGKVVESTASTPQLPSAMFVLAIGLMCVLAIFLVGQAYGAATDAIFEAALDGLDQARYDLLSPAESSNILQADLGCVSTSLPAYESGTRFGDR